MACLHCGDSRGRTAIRTPTVVQGFADTVPRAPWLVSSEARRFARTGHWPGFAAGPSRSTSSRMVPHPCSTAFETSSETTSSRSAIAWRLSASVKRSEPPRARPRSRTARVQATARVPSVATQPGDERGSRSHADRRGRGRHGASRPSAHARVRPAREPSQPLCARSRCGAAKRRAQSSRQHDQPRRSCRPSLKHRWFLPCVRVPNSGGDRPNGCAVGCVLMGRQDAPGGHRAHGGGHGWIDGPPRTEARRLVALRCAWPLARALGRMRQIRARLASRAGTVRATGSQPDPQRHRTRATQASPPGPTAARLPS